MHWGQLRGVQEMIDREADQNCVQPDECDDPEAREKPKRLVQIMTNYG